MPTDERTTSTPAPSIAPVDSNELRIAYAALVRERDALIAGKWLGPWEDAGNALLVRRLPPSGTTMPPAIVIVWPPPLGGEAFAWSPSSNTSDIHEFATKQAAMDDADRHYRALGYWLAGGA